MMPIPFALDEVITIELRGGVRAVLNDEGTRWTVTGPGGGAIPALERSLNAHFVAGESAVEAFLGYFPWEPERAARAAAEAFEGEIVDIQVPPAVRRELDREPPPGAVY